MATGEKLVSVDYEVFGKVQDVFFRKYTKKKARSLGLVGWVENTDRGTVVGQVQGPAEKIAAMKDWLRLEGSPESKIEKCVFTKEGAIEKLTHEIFRVVE
ncbi:hypothetical protein CHS0354_007484 [Potamilus streckersoni]|uniref:acylphosphatase n=1 Tax=Potamilus streckersoni TaxID=2493646 RepID=A0AAE0SVL0_9BIVA|nr:hypothetical protein CHS0354_007484 [Potamilus streckersoni]